MSEFGKRDGRNHDGYEPEYGYKKGSFNADNMYSTLDNILYMGCTLLVLSTTVTYKSIVDITDLDRQIYLLVEDGVLVLDNGSCSNDDDDKVWTDYYYYTNEDIYRNSVMAINHKTMTMDKEIKCVGINPHSADRACLTDKMYVRTQNVNSFDVIDARRGIWLKSVPLPYHPRTTGDQNLKYRLQLIAGKDNPGIAVIDTITDNLLFVDWYEKTNDPVGNQGGSAGGHPAWFDDEHFGYLDRIAGEVRIYRVGGSIGNFTFRHIKDLIVPTAMHTIQDDKIDWEPGHSKFYGTVEGDEDRGIVPAIQEFNYYGNGDLQLGRITNLPGSGTDDTIHHYGIDPDQEYLYIPTYITKKTHVIELSSMDVVKTYDSGLGGGHVNFSTTLDRACVTNHFDDHVTILDTKSTTSWEVKINEDTPAYPGPLIQSHSNWISDDGKYFFICNTHSGEFVKIDIENRRVYSKIYVGGHPEQSIS